MPAENPSRNEFHRAIPEIRGRRRPVLSLPVLVGSNFLALGLLGLAILRGSAQPPAAALAAAPHTFAVQISSPTPTRTIGPSLTPEPSRTPFPSLKFRRMAAITPTATPSPTPSPTIALPEEAAIEGISGKRQSMPLSCESRSAVDWAAHFGFEIDETTFFNGLPRHENPELGFVGNVYGSWGQIPPDDYGVHAPPVAQRLREYGLNAKHLYDMTWRQLKEEIAAGRPASGRLGGGACWHGNSGALYRPGREPVHSRQI